MKEETIRDKVREGYAAIAEQGGSCCSAASPCCGPPGDDAPQPDAGAQLALEAVRPRPGE